MDKERTKVRRWKGIAAEVSRLIGDDVSEDAAQRLARSHGLPYHEPLPRKPFAYVDELERWAAEMLAAEARRRRARVA